MHQSQGSTLKSAIAVMSDFGSLVGFYVVNHFYGLKPGIVTAVVLFLIGFTFRILNKEKISSFMIFTFVLVVGFGAVDLYLTDSFLYKFEASITNLATGVFFARSLRGPKPLIQEFYEKAEPGREITPEIAEFLRVLTWVWVAYFVIKAPIYLWISFHYPVEQALIYRAIIGKASLWVLLIGSFTFGKSLFVAWRAWRLKKAAGVAAGA